jgi:two-component system chemotaxis response regulator CheB
MPRHRAIRLLIVDDSRFIRTAVRAIVAVDPAIRVVGEARDGADAIALARVLRPDVITMDLEMPEVGGLEAIGAIMAERPIPIIVLSGHSRAGVWTTFEALGRGAVDFLEKPGTLQNMETRGVDRELRAKIRDWAHRPQGLWAAAGGPAGGGRRAGPLPPVAAPPVTGPPVMRPFDEPMPSGCDLVVVAVSTGGPNTVPLLLRGLGGPLRCPMVVAQHMPRMFTSGFAGHLAVATGLEVVEGEDDLALPPGRIVIIAGGGDGEVTRDTGGLRLRQRRAAGPGVHPSADLLFASAARAARQPVAVVLTGIGRDGTAGARAFAALGLPVLVQTPGTAVVWGMPSAVIDAGLATRVLAVEEIGAELARLVGAGMRVPALAR